MPADELDLQDSESFLSAVLRSLIGSLDVRQENNIDTSYPADGVRLDAVSYLERRSDYLGFVIRNYKLLFQSYKSLCDEESRRLFFTLIQFRILGYEWVRLPSNTPHYWSTKEAAQRVASRESHFRILPGDRPLHQFSIEVEGHSYLLDCLPANIWFTFFMRQYWLERPHVSVAPALGDHVIDAGACFGDTAISFAHAVGSDGRVHSFEVLGVHLDVIRHNVYQNQNLKNIVVHPVALGDFEQSGVVANGPANPGFSPLSRDAEAPIRRLDDLLAGGDVERVDFIKMDIEGMEMAALRGAEETIRLFRPRMAISLYHKWEDYFSIPMYIAGLGLGYRMYIENYTISDGETVLYCIPS